MKILFSLASMLLFLSVVCSTSHAQSYRYIDESGNIHFVDSFQDVPNRYRNQIEGFSPTPAATPGKKSGKSTEARQREVDREREKLERDRKKDEAKRKKLFEKQLKKNQKLKKEQAASQTPGASQTGGARVDDGVLTQFTPIPQPAAPSYDVPPQSQEP